MTILLCLTLFVVGANAQRTLNVDSYYDIYTGLATDTVSQTRTWNMYFAPNKGERLFYDFRVKLTEVVATTQTAVALQGKKMDTDSWSTITTLNYKGTGTDTTLVFAETSTASFYRFFNILITPSSGKVKPTFIKVAFKK